MHVQLMLYAHTKNAIAPAIIDRASVAEKRCPFSEIVSASVASAMEGADPKSPAKLFGLNRSPSNANVETNKPPATNRKIISFHIETTRSICVGPRRQSPRRLLSPSILGSSVSFGIKHLPSGLRCKSMPPAFAETQTPADTQWVRLFLSLILLKCFAGRAFR